MNKKNLYSYVWFLVIALSLCLSACQPRVSAQSCNKQITVILSLDGFRWDYPDKTYTPNLDQIAADGVKAESMIPSFPSKTFPNHYTIVTGLYPDHHGLVNNSFFNPELNRSYSMGAKDSRFDPAFYGGEPIWITAKKQGLITASFFWVGSDVPVQGMNPDYFKKYDGSIPYINRIDTIIYWLSLPESIRPRLILAYYEEPDGIGHKYGPEDPRTFEAVHEIDSLTGILYKRIKMLAIADSVNFIIVSDHGMGEISPKDVVTLRDYIPEKWPVRIEGGNPIFNLYASDGWVDSAYIALHEVPHIKVWKAGEVPAYLNYGQNPSCGNIVVVADSAWSVNLNRQLISKSRGTHGYDITDSDMHAIFYASGPAFKQAYSQPTFKNVDIYPLLSHLLGILPAPNDGDLNEIKGMLKNPEIKK